MKRRLFVLTAAVLTFTAAALSAQAPGRPAPAPAQAALPSPESVLGFKLGDDYKLATYTQAVDYLKKLDAASPRMQAFEAGKSSQGRTYSYFAISSPANLQNIEKYRQISLRLAHPEGLTDAEAKQLARDGKAIVHIDGGLHATEVAGPQTMPLLAYDLIRQANDPKFARILDNVIFLLWPTINPDGQEQVASYYMKTLAESGRGGSFPALYQDFVGHDNNRDAYMMNMIESRVMEHAWRQWEPQIIYVQHQTAPFPTRIWLPPFADPIGQEAPFIISRNLNMIGMAIARGLDEQGLPGATHMGDGFDAWYPGYIDYMPVFKNIAAFWTETAGAGLANPRTYTINDIPQAYRDFRPQPLYPSPWRPGEWHLADSMKYMEVASISTLDFAARYKDELLFDRYVAGRDQIARGKADAPYAYVVPQAQRDPVLAVELLRRIAFSGLRVSQLTSAATIDGTSYPAGTWVIPTDQEFAAMAREVLDVQKYPDLRDDTGGPEQPYDASGWTLPMSMDVTVVPAKTPLSAEARAAMRPVAQNPPTARPTPYSSAAADAAAFDSVPGAGFNTSPMAAAIVPPAGAITGTGDALAIDPAQINTMRALQRAWKAGATVRYTGGTSPAYQIVGLGAAAADDLVKSLALKATRTAPAGEVVKAPRIALYNPPNSMDAGWTRWVLEQYGVEYTPLTPGEPLPSPLASKFDVIVVTSEGGTPFGGGFGGRGGGRGGAGRGGGAPAQDPAELAKPFEEFIRGGGTLVCFNSASNAAIQQFNLPVTNVAQGRPRTELFINGSLLEVTTNAASQVMAGMPAKAAIFTDNSPVFEPKADFNGAVLAKYADTGSPLLSGYLLGESLLHGKAAALDVKLGDGHVVLLGFRPQWRGQTFSTFRVIFNSLLLSR